MAFALCAFVRAAFAVSGTRVEVADDGPGFAPEDLPHVFEPLLRGDRARAAATGGAGLGLAITRRLVHAHGARWRRPTSPRAARASR